MKYLIFSDTHLTEKFDQKKFNFLKRIISSADKVIIAGDFYDQYFIDLDKFLSSEWKKLFPLLKAKNTVYLPGNHDLISKTDKELIFCEEIIDEYQFESGDEKFIVQHGHEIAPGLEQFSFFTKPINKLITKIHNFTEFLLIKLFGWLVPGFYFYRYFDLKKTINFKKQKVSPNKWFILGHIHLPHLNKKIKYANTGFINLGLGSYIVVENGEVELHKERY
jgi:UDP-2,3-diacylglucosamine pyrophosphatase LpxH